MLLTILNDQKPNYLIVCFDRPKPTFRQELYAGYHEHRPALANDFVPQIKTVHEIVEKMDIPVFELDGYEADDLIGTIASYTGKKQIQTLIVSGDRDLLRLVNEHVWVLSPLVGLKTLTIYHPQKVEEKFGVAPSQFIDYKALIGDQSDGYPGVSGIGPKTASSLIRKFDTFENLYHHLKDVPPKLAEKLAIDAEQAALAKKLATIVTDAPIRIDLQKAAIEKVHMNNAKEAFEALGFNSLLTRLETLNGHVVESAKKAKEEKEKSEQLGLL
jgi:DNA polymerase-1